MEQHLKSGIKEIIQKVPQVGVILDEYDIGCTTCMVGTCLLQDVVGVHGLAPEIEKELMGRIEQAIYPDRQLHVEEIKPVSTKPKEIQYSPPIKKLVDEHAVIKRWLALVPKVVDQLEKGSGEAWDWVSKGIDFSRQYADRYHHAKEEDILFEYAHADSEIIQAMYEEHDIGRNHVKQVLESIVEKNVVKAKTHLNAYGQLLKEHIKKEDEILYPWIDRNLSTTQVGELFARCAKVDQELDPTQYDHYQHFIAELEAKLG